jgi:hypothetical protein
MPTNYEDNGSLPVSFDGGGLHDDDRLTRGAIAKCVDGIWSVKNDPTFRADAQFLCIGTGEGLQSWQNQMVIESRRKTPGVNLSDLRDELNARIPREQWEADLSGKPRAPWQHVWFAYLVRLSDGAIFTLINSTVGCRICVRELADRVEVTPTLRQMHVAPIVKLGCKPMKTEFGIKQRPHFEIVEWRSFGTPPAPTPVQGPKTPQIGSPVDPTQVGKPVKPVTTAEEMNDALPF